MYFSNHMIVWMFFKQVSRNSLLRDNLVLETHRQVLC